MDMRESEVVGLRSSKPTSMGRLLRTNGSTYSQGFPHLVDRPAEPSAFVPQRYDIGMNHDSGDELIQSELQQIQDELGTSDRRWPHEVQTLLQFIHANIFEEWLNVSAVKARCGFKNNNVSSRFKYTVGMGMRRYIERLRMKAAGKLLAHEANFQIFLIALSLGYSSAESFNRSFRRFFDTTPSAYRSRTRKQR